MGINAVLEPSLYLKVPGSNFCQLKTVIGAVLSIAENLRSKGQRSLDGQIEANCGLGATCTLQSRFVKANV